MLLSATSPSTSFFADIWYKPKQMFIFHEAESSLLFFTLRCVGAYWMPTYCLETRYISVSACVYPCFRKKLLISYKHTVNPKPHVSSCLVMSRHVLWVLSQILKFTARNWWAAVRDGEDLTVRPSSANRCGTKKNKHVTTWIKTWIVKSSMIKPHQPVSQTFRNTFTIFTNEPASNFNISDRQLKWCPAWYLALENHMHKHIRTLSHCCRHIAFIFLFTYKHT